MLFLRDVFSAERLLGSGDVDCLRDMTCEAREVQLTIGHGSDVKYQTLQIDLTL